MRGETDAKREKENQRLNLYVANATAWILAVMAAIWVLNEVGIFAVQAGYIRGVFITVTLLILVIQMLAHTERYAVKDSTKYYISLLVCLSTLISVTVLEQWADLLILLPMVLALQYNDRKINVFTAIFTLLMAAGVAPLCVALGVWNASFYEFLLKTLGFRVSLTPVFPIDYAQYVWKAFLYVSVPRMGIVLIFTAVLHYVTKQARVNYNLLMESRNFGATDTLTGLLNRASYLSEIEQYKTLCPNTLTVIYGDVNGLHELNNEQGHAAGDLMLKTCSEELHKMFGEKTYRIGGDEFAAFLENQAPAEGRAMVQRVKKILEEKGYFMAIGVCSVDEVGNVEDAVRMAENRMYREKALHYQMFGKERRQRASQAAVQVPVAVDEKHTILLALQDKKELEELTKILGDKYNLLSSENGEDAYRILQDNYAKISLVIINPNLAQLSGEVMMRMAGKDALLQNIPFIVVTMPQDVDMPKKYTELGAVEYFREPLVPNEFLARVSVVIRLRQSNAVIFANEMDEIPGLYTRRAFLYHATEFLRDHREESVDILMSYIDGFETIIQRYGSAHADAVLSLLVTCFKEQYRENIIMGRFTDNQVSIICLHKNRDMDEMAREIAHKLQREIPLSGVKLKIGVYEEVDYRQSVRTSCEYAASAMWSIEHKFDRRVAFYTQAMHRQTMQDKRIELEMNDALKNGEIKVYYQPKHELKTGKLVGAEALVRWAHPEKGLISPSEFVSVFEKTGFIRLVDYYVWRNTCKNLKEWIAEGKQVVPISVNASRIDLQFPNASRYAISSTDIFHIPASLLHIEVTENAFTENVDAISETLRECRAAGFKVELDDFGTGYSSLSMLGSMPLDIIKIDKSMLQNVTDEKKNGVLKACVQIAKALGLQIVAEGVENDKSVELLKKMDVEFAQGYYYSKPLPEDKFIQYAQNQEVPEEFQHMKLLERQRSE